MPLRLQQQINFLNVYNKSGLLYKLFYKSEKNVDNDVKDFAVK